MILWAKLKWNRICFLKLNLDRVDILNDKERSGMTRVLALLVSGQLTAPRKHFLAKVTSVRQHSCVQRAFVDLEVGLGSEGLVAEPTLEVSPAFMDDFNVSLQFHLACQQLSTVVTGEHFLWNNLAPWVHPMFPASVSTQRHCSSILAGAVLTCERSVGAVLGPHVVLKSHCVDEAFLSTDLTLVDYISTWAGFLVELVIIPFLQPLVTSGAFNLFVGILRKKWECWVKTKKVT